jgi:hypothetical protein
VIATDAMLDTTALMQAEPAEKIAVALAWQEHFKSSNAPSQRQEWARAFGRHAMAYLSTALPN